MRKPRNYVVLIPGLVWIAILMSTQSHQATASDPQSSGLVASIKWSVNGAQRGVQSLVGVSTSYTDKEGRVTQTEPVALTFVLKPGPSRGPQPGYSAMWYINDCYFGRAGAVVFSTGPGMGMASIIMFTQPSAAWVEYPHPFVCQGACAGFYSANDNHSSTFWPRYATLQGGDTWGFIEATGCQ